MGTRMVRYQPGTCEFVLYVEGRQPSKTRPFPNQNCGHLSHLGSRNLTLKNSDILIQKKLPNTVGFNQTFQSVDGEPPIPLLNRKDVKRHSFKSLR